MVDGFNVHDQGDGMYLFHNSMIPRSKYLIYTYSITDVVGLMVDGFNVHD